MLPQPTVHPSSTHEPLVWKYHLLIYTDAQSMDFKAWAHVPPNHWQHISHPHATKTPKDNQCLKYDYHTPGFRRNIVLEKSAVIIFHFNTCD